jgi:hypothetical protein
MSRFPKEIADFMEKFSVGADEVWPVPGGKAYAVKHKALERIAIAQKITFERPAVIGCDLVEKSMVVCVFGKMGEREEWTFGEASPGNNKNQYFAAMTEKRAKDRVILKLLSAHGDLYSEDEADDFKQAPRQNPHVTRPADILPTPEYDQHGEIVDNIPHAESAQKLRVADQRPLFAALQKEAHAFTDSKAFLAWMKDEKTIARVADFKRDWQEMFRGICKEHLAELRKQEAGDDMRMAG